VEILLQRTRDGVRDNRAPFRDGLQMDREALSRFTLRVDNLVHINGAYGDRVVRDVLGGVRRLLSDLLRQRVSIVATEDGLEVILPVNSAWQTPPALQVTPDLVKGFCASIAQIPIETSSGRIAVFVSANWNAERGDQSRACQTPRFLGWPPEADDRWAIQYRADMALLVMVLDMIDPTSQSYLGLAWQPVRDIEEGSPAFYYEALLQLVERDGSRRSASLAVAAFERLGFARVLDVHVAALVVAELLRGWDVVLGFKISAHSTLRDGCWDEVEAVLERNPMVARRLVIEITQTVAIPNIADAARFVADMRRLGCEIALDNFGVGFGSIRELLGLSPDFVKIDSFFLGRAERCGEVRDSLFHLVGFARSFASKVIVEGVTTRSHAELAQVARAHGQQGRYWGEPTFYRPWTTILNESVRHLAGARPPAARSAERGLQPPSSARNAS
jgi:EAL domain-containing protein (putative c-di-GMP-specific phosphodiesterase class I)